MTPMPPNFSRAALETFIPAENWTSKGAHFASLWEIPQSMKCPLVGTCLSIDDHHHLLKKAGFNVRRICPASLHAAVMENIDAPTRVARRIDTFLKKKYLTSATEWLHSPESAIRKLWETGIQTGELELPLYIIACRSNISQSLQAEVFGTLHMLGHTAKRDLLESRRMIVRLEKLLAEEKELSRRIQKNLKEKTDTLMAKTAELEKWQRLETNTSTSSPREETAKESLENLSERLQRLQDKNQALNQRVKKLETERAEWRKAPQISGSEPAETPIQQTKPHALRPFPPKAEVPDLGYKRVLVVGGRPCMRPLYRNAVETTGGQFEYHDGCIHGGKQTLEARVRRSDIILCPVNCNSHGACGLVKEICRKHGKCLRMLDSSSRSAITAALEKTALQEEESPSVSNPLIAGNRFSKAAEEK
ncbi:DUF2325 domain-containing protein [Desulfobotulus sp. H1]|uniref:DUF2325 domain-containing protein n=1 Tax=Desulfobotulus pelophilus TaxID=2823377 RepID=A0ABT3N6Q4_9BACT|nr:DUF2325 domain-containing protein [Desulfobotulus pelophilus]MCW7753141.1 DUF2325 domain-containing protein [Desulfobotulus pelophilus]